MAGQRGSKKKHEERKLTGLELLGLRVSTMIGSPKAQLDRRALIHRLDTDDDEAWDGVMELLGETEGLRLAFDDDGSAIVTWDAPTESDAPGDTGESDAVTEQPVPF